jgi:hypothetical protein
MVTIFVLPIGTTDTPDAQLTSRPTKLGGVRRPTSMVLDSSGALAGAREEASGNDCASSNRVRGTAP